MKASIVDLRYKMKDVLAALKRNEVVKIFYHGKISGTIIPPQSEKNKNKVEQHSFFGMHKVAKNSVTEEMNRLRGGRYEDIDDVV